MKLHRDWTPERESQLKVLWLQGLSCSQIASRLGGVTRNAVIGKVTRMDLPKRITKTRSYRQRTPAERPAVSAVKAPKPKAPMIKPEPIRERGAKRGPTNVRFIDRKQSQCPMFCAGEELAFGLVCGAPIEADSSWCKSCGALVFQPFRPMAKVA